MANSLLKLTVESSEYDAKLKKAAEGVRHLADVAHKSAGDMTGLEQSTLDYIKSIGEMETKSRTAAGSVNELSNTYKELTIIYNNQNEVEKADEGGKALAASLEQLKQRAQDARSQLDNASKSLQENASAGKESSGMLDALSQKFTLNIDALKLFDMGLTAAKAALDVAKDAFFASESNVDEWGRTVKSAEGIYNSFLVSLNTGDFSGFLNNIGQVTQAAREAYNALDELGTRMTIINPERAKLQARQQELRATIRREGKDSDAGKQALAELKKIEPKLSKSFQTESKMNRTAFEALVKQRLAEGGINLNQKSFQQFMKTFSSDDAFQQLRKNARGSSELKATSEIGKFQTIDTRNVEQKLMDLFTDEWRKANSGYLTASFQAQGAAATNALGNARYMKEGGSGKSGNTQKQEQTEFQKNQKKINELTQQYVDMSKQGLTSDDEHLVKLRDEIKELEKRNGLLSLYSERAHGRLLPQTIDMNAKGVNRTMFGDLGLTQKPKGLDKPAQLDEKGMKALTKQMEKQLKQDVKALKEQQKEEKALTKIANKSRQFASGLSEVSSGLQSLGIQLPEGISEVVGVINGVSQIIQGVGTIISVFSTSAMTANTIALDANTAALWANAAKPLANGGFAPGFALGGIVPHAASGILMGNSYSGDNIGNVRLNAGELVLNKAQQGNLAAQLTGGGLQNLRLEAVVSGEQIMLASNNRGRRTGRGEIVQSRRRR